MKNIIFKFIFLLFLTFSIFTFQKNVFSAQTTQINFFYSTTCPHCAKAKNYLMLIKNDYPQLVVNQYEVSNNSNKLLEFYKKYKVPVDSYGFVPIIFTEDKFYIGFSEDVSNEIEKNIVNLLKNPSGKTIKEEPLKKLADTSIKEKIDSKKYTLPILTILLGVMDGFNICSLSALLIILTLVLSLKSRVKTLIFGSTFIFTTAIVYSFLIFFWYQLFNIITPHIRQMEFIIGVLTIGGGIYFLIEFIKFRKQGPACNMGPVQKIESNFSKKFKLLLSNKTKTLAVVLSIFLFAVVITIIEFPCSAAVPVAFVGMLTKAQLPSGLYFFYIMLYVVFYMLDELLVFFIAFFTMKLWFASSKFNTWIPLVESVILFLLGIYYLFGLF